MSQVKPVGKLFIILLVVGALAAGAYYTGILDTVGGDNSLKAQVVTYSGMAGGPYYNRGYSPNENSLYKKNFGLDVEFIINDDVMNARQALISGQLDAVVLTVDGMPSAGDKLTEFGFKVFGFTDKSQGADVATAIAQIQKWTDLKNVNGRKGRVGYVPFTPSQFAFKQNLDAADMKWDDVEHVTFNTVPEVVDAMITDRIDVGWVWAPDDQTVYEQVKGSHALWSTKDGSEMLYGVIYTTQEILDKKREQLTQLLHGWMVGNAEINSSPQARKLAAQIMSDAYGGEIPADFFEMTFDNVRLCTYGDQMNLFGLNATYTGMTAERVYIQSAKMYQELGVVTSVPSWREISETSLLKTISLTGPEHAAQKPREFSAPTPALAQKTPIATKPIHVNFESNSAKLNNVAEAELDKFADIMKMNRNARFRIDGHTDATGDRTYNIALSQKRAWAAAQYFIDEYGFSRNQFIVEGHGPDQPVADNSTENGRWMNRRTEIGIIVE